MIMKKYKYHRLIRTKCHLTKSFVRSIHIVDSIMWKIIISVVVLVTATPGNASIEDLLGEWVPIAVYPGVTTNHQVCGKVTFNRNKNQGSVQCTDDRKFELIDVVSSEDPTVYTVGMLFDEDLSTGVVPFNVTCTNDDKKIKVLVVAKSIDSDHAFFYKPNYNDEEPLTIFVHGRNIPTRAELSTVVSNVAELRGKSLGKICTKD